MLQRDRRQGLGLALDRDPFLRFDGLVESVRVPPIRHQATGELIDDHHAVVLDDVLLFLGEHVKRAQRVLDVVQRLGVFRGEQVLDPQVGLRLVDAGVRQGQPLGLLVDLEVLVAAEPSRERGELLVEVVRVGRRTGDDQRGARLIDQDVVDLVDDGEVERPLDLVAGGQDHVVAQVVEAELVVRPVGDVGRVGGLPLLRCGVFLEEADGEAEKLVDRPHPLPVASGQVVVDGDHVDLAAKGIQGRGERRNERLSLSGLHLGDALLVEGDRTEDLHVERS